MSKVDLSSWVELTLTFSPEDIAAIERAIRWTDVDETGILAHIVALAQDKQEKGELVK
jgi:hypothetical protein